MPKNTEKEVESEISSSGLEDKYLSKFAYFLDLFDEESIKKVTFFSHIHTHSFSFFLSLLYN